MHKTRALTVIRAAARLRVLGRHSHDPGGDGGEPADHGGDSALGGGHGDLEAALLAGAALAGGPGFGPGAPPSSGWRSYSGTPAGASPVGASPRGASPPGALGVGGGGGFGGFGDGGGYVNGGYGGGYSGGYSSSGGPPHPPGASPEYLRALNGGSMSRARRERRDKGGALSEPLCSRPITPLPLHHPWYFRDAVALRDMVASSYFNLLLVCVPLGALAWARGWGAVPVFTLNFLALVPLALLLGDVTEDLALRFGDIVGGLLNATFGNVVEIIVSLAALTKGLYTIVSTSLLGSILSNLLLVLGCCFFFGGLRFQTQTFNPTANQATSSLLFLSCIGIIIPTAATNLSGGGDGGEGQEWILEISRGTAVVMLVIYSCYLIFQLHSHHELFRGDDGDEEPTLTLATSLVALALITACVAVCSEFLTGAIEDFCRKTGLSHAFVGMIILPIAGNACEHIVAVLVALRNKMDLALGVAVGSSIQIAIFAIPLAVVVGWAIGRPFSLDFDPFATLALTISVIHSNFVTAGASSHWLMGAQLIATYLLIALTFLFR